MCIARLSPFVSFIRPIRCIIIVSTGYWLVFRIFTLNFSVSSVVNGSFQYSMALNRFSVLSITRGERLAFHLLTQIVFRLRRAPSWAKQLNYFGFSAKSAQRKRHENGNISNFKATLTLIAWHSPANILAWRTGTIFDGRFGAITRQFTVVK